MKVMDTENILPHNDLEYDLIFDDEASSDDLSYDVKGRNSRPPKRANHGARPCSSVMRKLKKKGWYHKVKDK